MHGNPCTHGLVYPFKYSHTRTHGYVLPRIYAYTQRLIDSGTKEHIFRINFVGPDHAVGFAVGANDLLLRTEDHGETWQQAYIFRASGMVTNSRINNIVMLDAQLGYAAYRNTLLVTGDGGKTWTQGQPIVVGNHMMNCISDVAVVKAPVFTPSFTHATLSIYIDELGVQSTLIPFALTIKNTGTADLKILDVQFEGLPLSSFSGQVTGNGGASGDINTGSSGLDGTATANNDSTTGTVPVAGSIYRNDIFFTGDDPIGQVFTPEGETKAYTLEWDSDGYQSVNSPMTASIVFIHNGPTKKSIVTLALLLYDLKADVQESWLDTYWPVFPALALMIIFAVFNCLRARHHRITEYNRKHQEKYHLSFFRFWCCAQNKWHSDDSRFWIDEYSSSEWSSDFSDSSGSSSTYSGSSGSYDSDSGDSDDSTSSEGSIYQDEDINSDGSVRNRTTGKKKKVADF